MGKYLITGRSGVGKSTICRELSSRGHTSLDGDSVPGLAGWIDLVANMPTEVDYTKIIDKTKVGWNWNGTVLAQLLADNNDLFLCGSADNQMQYHSAFDKVFVLDLDETTQRQRVLDRTEHDYGKTIGMMDIIIAEQKEFVTRTLVRGAIAIDAVKPAHDIADQIEESLARS